MRKFLMFVTAIALAVSTAGCGQVDRTIAHYTGYSKICVEGVSYIQFTSGASVQVDKDGKPIAC